MIPRVAVMSRSKRMDSGSSRAYKSRARME